MEKLKTPKDLESLRKSLLEAYDPNKIRIRICMTGCRAYGAEGIRDAVKSEIEKNGLQDKVEVIETGCHGFCARAPVMVIDPQGVFYQQMTVEDVPEIISETVIKGNIIERLIFEQPDTGEKIPLAKDVPFYKEQIKIVLRNCGLIDPKNIMHYIARDGYSALTKVLTQMTPDEVINVVKESGLRGRGGAGFPTGVKWGFARAEKVKEKYIICNADEGDPGAFMDRAVLEGDPHTVIEGMLIGAFAIGAEDGYIYVRAEYPIAVEHINIAVKQAEELGLLGDNILGTGLNFHLHIKEGAGAFVCGEETALIASIEGRRGMPRMRPPFPANSGLWGKPTNINNVETWANIPPIIINGSDWYASMGTDRSKGTKAFALAGKVNNTGLIEVPMGITLRKIIFDIGGGIPGGKEFKAVQVGGPSGGCLPAEHLDLPIDYDSLISAGAIVGSGGMIVMDEESCMVDVARYFMNFVQNESCGKCIPCRVGTRRMLEILNRITEGEGTEDDINLLSEMAASIKVSSLCALGQTAPNPVLTTLRYFKDEYEAHVKGQCCPAHVCPSLYFYLIDSEACTGCGLCKKQCPQQCISGERRKPHVINSDECIRCGICFDVCPFDAIIKTHTMVEKVTES